MIIKEINVNKSKGNQILDSGLQIADFMETAFHTEDTASLSLQAKS